MYLKELKTKPKRVYTNSLAHFSTLEQECNICILRDTEGDEVQVDCSHQGYINKLLASDFFTLTEVLVSNHVRNEGFILSIKGHMPLNGLTIRKKKPSFTEEERQRRAEHMRKIMNK